MKQGLQKQPQWFAYECPCTKGKLVLHTFRCEGFAFAPSQITEELSVPVEYMAFTLICEKCKKKKLRRIEMNDMDWFLDRLTPNVTHDPELCDCILWYWENDMEEE